MSTPSSSPTGTTTLVATVAAPDAISSTAANTRRSRITPVPTRFRHAVHTYHGVSPWSHDGARLLYLGFDDPQAPANIVVQDLQSGEEEVLASTPQYDFHTAAGQRWIFGDRAVVFKSRGERGECFPALACLDEPGVVYPLRRLSGRAIRHICADGEHALASSGSTSHGTARIERINLRTQESETLLTAEEALAILPAALRDPQASYSFNHPVFNSQETRLFLKLMQTSPAGATRFCAFFTLDLAVQEVRCWGESISGHPHWMPDGRHILNIKSPRDGSDNRRLVLMDTETGMDERLIDLPIEGPGHPAPSPDGRRIVTDAFTAEGRHCPIYLVDVKMRAVREIARLEHRFQGGNTYEPRAITRGQPHPVWSPDGRQLLVNFNYSGEHMGLLLIENF